MKAQACFDEVSRSRHRSRAFRNGLLPSRPIFQWSECIQGCGDGVVDGLDASSGGAAHEGRVGDKPLAARAQPRNGAILVFTQVSSMKTRRVWINAGLIAGPLRASALKLRPGLFGRPAEGFF